MERKYTCKFILSKTSTAKYPPASQVSSRCSSWRKFQLYEDVSWGPCRVSASPFESSKTHGEELKPMTSLCEELEESEVCQFGGFPPRKKTPGFFTFRLTWIFFDEYS
jgi:hypothetical protein